MFTRLIAIVLYLVLAPLALADGLIIIHNPPAPIPGHFPFAPLQITYHNVDVTIDNNIATTTVDQEFRNPSPSRLEGTYIFPLPDGAHIDKFSMDVSGKMTDAELLDADKARSIYEDIVRRQRDPALLEYVGRGAFKARIFPIEPNSTKQIRIRYTQLLKSDNALTEYVYPLNTEKFSSTPLNRVSVKVHVKSDDPIKTLYCPSHVVQTQRTDERSAIVTYDQKDVRPDTDFRLVYTCAGKPVDIRLLTYAKTPEDGYFLLMASPGIDTPMEQVQPRDITFVIDTSGSMAGAKLEQAKKALRFCIANLNANDRFQVIRFSTEAQPLWGELMKATPHAREKANAFIDSFKAMGGTAIEDALKTALKASSEISNPRSPTSSPSVIVFLTDGQPTVGETNEDKLVAVTGSSANTRIFCFGIGDDINTHLLDRIAGNSNAFSTYVAAKEDIEVKVSNFYSGIQSPVLTNVSLAFAGSDIRAYDLMPKTMPDLFKGQTLYVAGRYHGTGPAAVALNGMLNGKAVTFAQDVSLSATPDTGREYIAQLWATRRVGWLLDEIRLHGESAELKDEVTRLARDFGIVTPYTSYLIVEDEQRRNVPVDLQTMRELSRDNDVRQKAESFYQSNNQGSARLAKSGPQGVTNAQAMGGMKDAVTVAPMPSAAPAAEQAMAKHSADARQPQGYRVATNYAQQARVINGKAFYQNGNTWTDATAQNQKNLKPQVVKFGSDEYFTLLKKDRNAATWLALGTEVDVVIDGVLYQIRG